jgi:GH24 family phage-related lysozyme (muramidase)
VDACAKIGTGPFDGSVAMRFLDAGHRKAWAKQLEAIIGHEKEAHGALATARETMK